MSLQIRTFLQKHNITRPIPFAIGWYIIISASFARQLFSLLGGPIGATICSSALALLLIALYYRSFAPNKLSLKRILISAGIFLLLSLFIYHAKYASEKMHYIEYALLGYFAAHACKDRTVTTLMTVMTLVLLISINDELFQWILPYRRFDLRDIMLNLVGGIGGCLLFFMKGKNS